MCFRKQRRHNYESLFTILQSCRICELLLKSEELVRSWARGSRSSLRLWSRDNANWMPSNNMKKQPAICINKYTHFYARVCRGWGRLSARCIYRITRHGRSPCVRVRFCGDLAKREKHGADKKQKYFGDITPSILIWGNVCQDRFFLSLTWLP